VKVRYNPGMPVTISNSHLRSALQELALAANSSEELMARITEALHQRMSNYNWVGFYMLQPQPDGQPMLALGPFQGATTPHTSIPLNQGICGAAASTGDTIIVDDVNKDPRYLACSRETKSEIVAPVYANGNVIGELDIDSHVPAAFAEDDRELVEYCARLVGEYIEKHGA